MERTQLIETMNNMKWYHLIELAPGIVTPGIERREREPMLAYHRQFDFDGRRVLEVGCMDGYWSFEAEKLGATEIWATDDDASAAQGLGRPNVPFAIECLGSSVRHRGDVSVYDVDRCFDRPFDVIIFYGVLYHLRYPVLALSKLRRVLRTGGTLLLETAVVLDTEEPVMRWGHEYIYPPDRSTWCAPSVPCLRYLLESAYFDVELCEPYLRQGDEARKIGRAYARATAVERDPMRTNERGTRIAGDHYDRPDRYLFPFNARLREAAPARWRDEPTVQPNSSSFRRAEQQGTGEALEAGSVRSQQEMADRALNVTKAISWPAHSPEARIDDTGVSAQKCVVIGNGPSLRGFDLTRLSGIDTIGMNAAYRHWERIGWYPTHYACLDDEVIETHHAEIARLMDQGLCETAFLSGQFLFHHPEVVNDDRFVFLDQFVQYWFERRGGQFKLEDRTYEPAFQSSQMSKLTTGSHAVRYAIWRGYMDIALIGIDLRYVDRIPESVAGEGIKLSIARTPDHNPNYFFDDYQRTGDRFNVANPDMHHGELHPDSFRALRDDLAAKDLGVRVVNANPASELSRQGILPFQDLDAFIGVRSLGAVVVPCVASSKEQILANLRFWARPEAAPLLWPRSYKPDLIFSFNNGETAEALESAISEAFGAHGLGRYFNTLGFERLDLRGESDVYETDYTKPVGAQGYKAGPSNQFFETMRRVRGVGRYVFNMEPDSVPIRPDWLGQLVDRLEHSDAWIIGSVYSGRGTLNRRIMRHLNGNASYAVGDPAFQDFLVDLRARLADLVLKEPWIAYDVALEVLFTGASCEAGASEKERALWGYFKTIAHRFHGTDYIQNVSARIDVQEPDPELLADVRANSPGAYVIHNSPLARTLTA